MALSAVVVELVDEERRAARASGAERERGAELAVEREASVGLKAEIGRLREELATLIEVHRPRPP